MNRTRLAAVLAAAPLALLLSLSTAATASADEFEVGATVDCPNLGTGIIVVPISLCSVDVTVEANLFATDEAGGLTGAN